MKKIILFIFLVFFIISNASSQIVKYNRSNWKHWIDVDKDCQNTRDEVLIRDSIIPVKFKTRKKCKVKSGLWQ